MLLSDVKHQARAQRLIQRAVVHRRIPHAYLFHGPDGVGKEMLARGLAQLLLCGSPVERTLDPGDAETVGLERLRTGCGDCEDCRSMAAETHPDWHLIYRQLNREHPDPQVRKRKALDLGVDVLRHFVIEKVGLTPARGRAKVFVIREADRITTQAQNAMLKTLEEPPGTTYLILLGASTDRLLATVRSRCQVVPLSALPLDFVRSRLMELRSELSGDPLEWYVQSSDGSIGLALSGVDDGLYELNKRLIDGLARGSTARGDSNGKAWLNEAKALGELYQERDRDITGTEATRSGLKSVFHLVATWYADVLRRASGEATMLVNRAWRSEVEQAAKSMQPEQAAQAINRIAQAEQQLNLNANTQLVVEVLLTDLAEIGAGEPLLRESARA